MRKGKVVALIPARGGSKRILKKNLRSIKGIPLVGYAIEHALCTKGIDEVYVSTDDTIISKVAKNYGANVPFIRPQEFARDESTDFEVFKHFLEWYINEKNEIPELIVQIRPTAPVREWEKINEAINLIRKYPNADSLRSISVPHQSPFKMWLFQDNDIIIPVIKEQNLKNGYDFPTQKLPKAYGQDGFVDIIRPSTIMELGNMAGNTILGFTGHGSTLDIDTLKDLNYAGMLIKNNTKTISKDKFLAGRVGIIQGRLSEAPEGVLQCFPKEWKKEFLQALEAGYSHIEILRDRKHNKNNPLWVGSLYDIQELEDEQLQTGVSARVICDDYILECDWDNLTATNIKTVIDLIYLAGKLGVSKIVYPLMENASIDSEEKRENAAYYLNMFAKVAEICNIEICIEVNLGAEQIRGFLSLINSKNVSVCFDSGNLIFAGFNPVDEVLKLNELISHVHIKDKNELGENVKLGNGNVDFLKLILALQHINYSGFITFETSRGNNPFNRAMENLEFIKREWKRGNENV